MLNIALTSGVRLGSRGSLSSAQAAESEPLVRLGVEKHLARLTQVLDERVLHAHMHSSGIVLTPCATR